MSRASRFAPPSSRIPAGWVPPDTGGWFVVRRVAWAGRRWPCHPASMAVYDYLCRTCDRVVEVRASFSEKDAGLRPSCPSCEGEDLRRLFTAVAVGTAGARATSPAAGGGGGCCGGTCGCG